MSLAEPSETSKIDNQQNNNECYYGREDQMVYLSEESIKRSIYRRNKLLEFANSLNLHKTINKVEQ